MSRGPMAHHWLTPMAFVPFAVLLAVHKWCGLSDAMLAAPKSGDPHSLLLNAMMVLAFYLGVAGYVAHTQWMGDRGWQWVAVKLLVLVVGWIGLLVAMGP